MIWDLRDELGFARLIADELKRLRCWACRRRDKVACRSLVAQESQTSRRRIAVVISADFSASIRLGFRFTVYEDREIIPEGGGGRS